MALRASNGRKAVANFASFYAVNTVFYAVFMPFSMPL